MPLMSGKRAVLEMPRQEGVEIIFGNPGAPEFPLMDALAEDYAIRSVLALQRGVAGKDPFLITVETAGTYKPA